MAKKEASGAKPMSKTEIYSTLAERTGLSRKDVSKVFDELTNLINQQLTKKGPEVFNIPGLMKLTVQHKPAKKARKGINPFTGEETMFKAKPASKGVKIRPLKALKDMVK
ncbi:MAG: HU family DNA-binding protein [Planctomycetes bacterium]|nr:HU family DNA-binding protein [Planctomycetota bacterium]